MNKYFTTYRSLLIMLAAVSPARAHTFSNTAPITIPSLGTSTPYPSNITTSGVTAPLVSVTVKIVGLSHTNPDDLDILLVGPGGDTVVLMSDCGGISDVSNVDLTFTSSGSELPDSIAIASGTYSPSNFEAGDTYPAPAPGPGLGEYGYTLNTYEGSLLNGTWSLYVVDDLAPGTGTISGGWSITLSEKVSDGFTYQGRLKQAGTPFTGLADFKFTLTNGRSTQIGNPITLTNIQVTEGLFTVLLNATSQFGPTAFDGESRQLEISVAIPPGSALVPLSPAQPLTATPFALTAQAIDTSLISMGSKQCAAGPDEGVNETVQIDADSFTEHIVEFIDCAGHISLFDSIEPLSANVHLSGTGLISCKGNITADGNMSCAKLTVSDESLIVRETDESLTQADFTQDLAKAGINIVTDFTTDAYTPGLFWSTQNNNATNPKAGIYLKEIASGSEMHFGTSNSFSTGITNDAIMIDPAGNVGVGTAVPERRMQISNGGSGGTSNSSAEMVVEDNTSCYINIMAPDASERGVMFGSPASNVHGGVYYTNSVGLNFRTGVNSTKMTIDDTGNVGIGRTPTANRLEVEGNASKTVAGSWLANSDAGIKQDIETISGALETLSRVRPVSFRYCDQYRSEHSSIEDHRYINVIAQEFAEVFPHDVKSSGEKLPDGNNILQVDTYPLTLYSVAAINELREEKDLQIEQKDKEIAELKARLDRLEALILNSKSTANGGAR